MPLNGTITIDAARARQIIWSYLRAGYDWRDAGPLATEIAKALKRG